MNVDKDCISNICIWQNLRAFFIIEVVRHRNTSKMSPRTVYSHGRLTAMTLTNAWDEVFFVCVLHTSHVSINTDLQRIWKTENADTPFCTYINLCNNTDRNVHWHRLVLLLTFIYICRASENLAPWHWNALEDETLFQFVRLIRKV